MLKKSLIAFSALVIILVSLGFVELGELDPVHEVEIYLLSNDIHTDIAVPVRNDVFDWETFLDPAAFKSRGEWIEVGWGDRQFYFEMPTWDKFTLRLAADALFLPDPAVMHVTYLEFHPSMYKSALKIKISKKKYAQLVQVLKAGFVLKNNKPVILAGKAYDATDNFYEAHGSYSIIRTCNQWTSDSLAEVGLPHPLWAPTKYSLERIWRKYQ